MTGRKHGAGFLLTTICLAGILVIGLSVIGGTSPQQADASLTRTPPQIQWSTLQGEIPASVTTHDCLDNDHFFVKSPRGDRVVFGRVTENCEDSPRINISFINERNDTRTVEGVITVRVDSGAEPVVKDKPINDSDNESTPKPPDSPHPSPPGPSRQESTVDRKEYHVQPSESPELKLIVFDNISVDEFNVTVEVSTNFQQGNVTETFTMRTGSGTNRLSGYKTLMVPPSNPQPDCARVAKPLQDVTLDAEFTYTPTNPDAGETVEFDAGDTGAEDSIVIYRWDFTAGDGLNNNDAISASPKVRYIYREPGFYFVVLTVVDENGNIDSDQCRVRVRKTKMESPIGNLDLPPSPIIVGEQVWFDASDSYDPDGGEIREYRWHFDDDGTPENVTNDSKISKRFWFPVPRRVAVVVVDDEGDTGIISGTIEPTFRPLNGIFGAILSLIAGYVIGNTNPEEVVTDRNRPIGGAVLGGLGVLWGILSNSEWFVVWAISLTIGIGAGYILRNQGITIMDQK